MTVPVMWSALDDYLVDLVDQHLGLSSPYADLQVTKVEACILRDLSEWVDWPLPAVAVIGRTISRKAGPHSGGVRHLDKRYPYMFMSICSGTRTTAWQRAKVLEYRLENMLRTQLSTIALVSDDGEIFSNRTLVEGGHIDIARRESSSEEDYFGFSFTEFEILSTV